MVGWLGLAYISTHTLITYKQHHQQAHASYELVSYDHTIHVLRLYRGIPNQCMIEHSGSSSHSPTHIIGLA